MSSTDMTEHDASSLSAALHTFLHGTGKTIGTAESCTAGGIAAAIVATDGASEYFRGGIVAYCDEVKERLLAVQHSTLVAQTAVCEDVAVQMARGVIQALDVDYALSATGIAGPSGGTAAIPVGTIWLCCSSRTTSTTLCLSTDAGRAANISAAICAALRLLITVLSSSESGCNN